MHPLIAFLAFIFSPSDDWALKRAYELALEPTRVEDTAKFYSDLTAAYPSTSKNSDGAPRSADTQALVVWSEMLESNGKTQEAQELRNKLLKNPELPAPLAQNILLKKAESLALHENPSEAREIFLSILTKKEPGSLTQKIQIDAQTGLLLCDLIENKKELMAQHATDLKNILGNAPFAIRVHFPLGLAAYVQENYKEAADSFAKNSDDLKSNYFLALSLRHQNKPQEALALWQKIQHRSPQSNWAEMSRFQIAETYFSLGDDRLCRAGIENTLTENPTPSLLDKYQFRLASLDMKAGDYAGALARLEKINLPKDLQDRGTVLIAESLIKTGQSKRLFEALAKKPKDKPSIEHLFQIAWAASFDGRQEAALNISEEALEGFYDAQLTPRLLLLQGLALEHLGKEAEAFATYQTISDRFPTTLEAAQSTDWILRAYLRLNRPLEAVTHGAMMWARLDPAAQNQHPDAKLWLAEANLKLNRYDDAEKSFQQFLSKADPEHELLPHAQFQRSLALAKAGHIGEALAQLDEFSKTASGLKKTEWVNLAHLQKGSIYFNDRKFENAIAEYRATTDSPKALYHEAVALYRMEFYTDAVSTWKKLAAAYPNTWMAETGLFRSGRTEFELGKSSDAVATFAQLIQTYPQGPHTKEALVQSAHVLYNSGDVAAAAPLYAEYLARYPTMQDVATITPYLASCYVKMGKSVQEAESLLQGKPPTETLAELRWDSGAKEYNQKNFVVAASLFSRMLTDTPVYENSPQALFYRAESLFLNQEWQNASGAFTNYLSLASLDKLQNAPLASFHRGIALYNQDKLLMAAKEFENFLQKYPNDNLYNDARENLFACYHNLGDWASEENMKTKYPSVSIPTAQVPDQKLAQSNLEDGFEQ